MTDKYKRITQAQYDIWIDSPVTEAYLQCLEWSAEQNSEVIENGNLIDITNNDLSMNRIQFANGEKSGLMSATKPVDHFKAHKLLEEEKHEDIGKDD